jgi:hypothetical protein
MRLEVKGNSVYPPPAFVYQINAMKCSHHRGIERVSVHHQKVCSAALPYIAKAASVRYHKRSVPPQRHAHVGGFYLCENVHECVSITSTCTKKCRVGMQFACAANSGALCPASPPTAQSKQALCGSLIFSCS